MLTVTMSIVVVATFCAEVSNGKVASAFELKHPYTDL